MFATRCLRPLGVSVALIALAVIVLPQQIAAAEKKERKKDGPKKPRRQAELLIELPEYCNTPDGMCVLPDGNVLLSVPNINDQTAPALIMKITPDDKLEKFYDPPKHPDTGKAYPFGICVDPDSGDVYYADLQWFAEMKPNWKSRVIRIPMKDGKPGEAEVVVDGLIVANAVVVRDGCLYVSDTTMVPDSKPLITGVYKIKLSEKRPVQLTKPLEDDPHCIATILTHNEKVPFGADGLCFDCDGNLYIGNFADGTVHKVEFDENGEPTTEKPAPIWAQAKFMKSADGLFYDKKKKEIYVADSLANAIQIVTLDGKVRTLAQEPTFDGKDGRMDQPCEAVLRGRDVIISNFDMPVEGGVNTEFEVPNCISIIRRGKNK
jgi:sugar lactone lactonase YvrE